MMFITWSRGKPSNIMNTRITVIKVTMMINITMINFTLVKTIIIPITMINLQQWPVLHLSQDQLATVI